MKMLALARRRFCTKKLSNVKQFSPVRKAVVVSTSHDIFTNLAMENWFYKNFTFEDNHLLMLWSNDPCVVIGRHQNPWTEADISLLKQMNINFARRHSGGGTVYHDRGNLNLTFFTNKERYNRKYNLEFISEAISRDYNINIEISPREDLTVRDFKISGTAAKLARLTAYHHCTLLINADISKLQKSLQPSKWKIKSNATKSVKSKILNLVEENPHISVESLIKTIGIRYLHHNNINTTTNHRSNIGPSQSNAAFHTDNSDFHTKYVTFEDFKFHLMSPDEDSFPGITEMRDELTSWKWRFGKTPKFTARRNFELRNERDNNRVFVLIVTVDEGKVEEVQVETPQNYDGEEIARKLMTMNSLKGTEYSDDVLEYLERHFGTEEDAKVEIIN